MSYLIIILGFLPGFVWLLFYLQEDQHPEPKKMIARVFAAGALSAAVALAAQFFVSCAFAYRASNCDTGFSGGVEMTPLLVAVFAAIEEFAKFGAAYLVIAKSKYFDEPIDAMVYMAVAALGFATVENVAALYDPGTPALLNDMLEVAAFRFVGTTLLHTLTASVIGYFWAIGIRDFKSKRFIVYGLILATALHAVFNYLILVSGSLIYPIIFVSLAGFFVLGDFERLKGKKI